MAGIWSRFFGSSVSTAVGYGMGSALGPALGPVTQEVANEVNRLYPFRPLPATLAAALVAEGKLTADDGAAEAILTGYNRTRFDRMVAQARGVPQIGQLFELWRREAIDRDAFLQALEVLQLPETWRERMTALRWLRPPVTDLVRFAVREVFNPQQRAALDLDAEFPDAFATQARTIGLDRDTAGDYWAAHWELPSATQGAEMLHRGLLSSDGYDGLLKALDYAPTWRGKLRAIADRIPPIGDMIRFAVREVYSPDVRERFGQDDDYPAEFTAEARLHGMNETRAKQYWAAHWNLPSATQGFDLYHRKLIDRPTLALLLRSLDVMPFWRDRLIQLAYRLPGRIDLRRMFRFGVIDRDAVRLGYERLGYSPADAETLTLFAEREKAGSSATRDLTQTHWAAEYEGGFVTENDYRKQLAALGYDDTETGLLVQLGDARKVAAARTRAVSRIASSYVGYQISRAEAEAALQRTQIRPEARTRIIDEWTIARDANVRQMTASQVRAAFKKGQYTRAEALAELAERGWRTADAEKFLDSA